MADPRNRLEPSRPESWDERTRQLLGETPLEILRTIAHHPRLLEPFLGFAAVLAAQGVLTRRDSELLALRTAWNCRSNFEWAHHVLYGRAAGLTDDEIAALAQPVGGHDAAWAWPDQDLDLIAAADELHAEKDVSDATWSRLASRFDAAQLVEIPLVVGQYTMLSMLANTTDVPTDPALPQLP